jgi:hypothetical protein
MSRHAESALSAFQDAFARALFNDCLQPVVAALARQPGFAVYRNGVIKHAVDALQANFPAVARLVGDEWFGAAAATYVRMAPPCTPVLLEYGADFPDFLRNFEPAAAIAYVAEVAALDRMWTEAHIAANDVLLDAAELTSITPQDFTLCVLRPRRCMRWAWFDTVPAYSIWSANRTLTDPPQHIDWQGEGALITRPRDCVEWRPLRAGGCVFLDACAAGEPIASATHAALAADSGMNLEQLLYDLLTAGSFAAIDRRSCVTIAEVCP